MKRLSEGFYPSLISAIFIMILMGAPGNCFPTVVTFWDWLSPDKIIHILIFGLFSFITLWGYRKPMLLKDRKQVRRFFITTIIIIISYGGLTEVLQKYLFIGRYGCLYDFFADIIGCSLGVLVFIFYLKKKLKKNKHYEE